MFLASLLFIYGILTKRWSIPLPNWRSLYIQIDCGVILLPNFLLAKIVAITAANINLILFAGIAASLIAPLFMDPMGILSWRQHHLNIYESSASFYHNYCYFIFK